MKKTSITSLLVLVTAIAMVSGTAIAQEWDGGSATNNDDGGDDQSAYTNSTTSDDSDGGSTDSTSSTSSGGWDGDSANNNDDGTSTNTTQSWDGDNASNDDDGSGTSNQWDGDNANNNDDGSNQSTQWDGGDANNNDDGGSNTTTGENDSENTQSTGTSSSGDVGSVDWSSVSIEILNPEVDFQLSPSPATVGEPVEVTGNLDHTSAKDVVVLLDGRTVAETRTNDNGEFSTSFVPESASSHTVAVKSADKIAEKELTVRPSVEVNNIRSSVSYNSPATVQVCANVDSQTTPEVRLENDGQTLMTKSQKGNVCFRTQMDEGTHELKVVGDADGNTDEAWTTVNVNDRNGNSEQTSQEQSMLGSILQPLVQAFATIVSMLGSLA